MTFNYIVTNEDSGKTVYHILKYKLLFSGKLIIKLKKSESGIIVNGKKAFTNAILSEGDILMANIPDQSESENVISELGKIDIIYEDDFLIALNKPAGMVVHPTYNHPSGTLSNFLAYYYIQNNIKSKIRPVSRLDRGTSGIVIFAKNSFVQDRLTGKHSDDIGFSKKYLALIKGVFYPESGTIDMPIARVPGSTIERRVSPDGAKSATDYITKDIFLYKGEKYSLTEFILKTGRTHQIRVHCLYSGHPILGDTLYFSGGSDEFPGLSRQALHAFEVNFIHPVSGEKIFLQSSLPSDIAEAIELLKQ